ncbi:glycoside hydrolase family 15 [Roseomonas gilardii]|uniref:Glycoside hydrolase family 15 n=1 Tax=Roseomonas gilardii TaxID=257708 RepID=A0A1L7ALE8_9PROT|nr:glycoside hydrolase family 15 protein [Roseomonas gilardii]APT59580.1 glycoside hydrolase family 15 [Roseomonas gilardii]
MPQEKLRTTIPDPAESPPEGAGFPIQDYAALGDGRSVALITPDGAVGWWCVPNMDSPPLFDRLLDAGQGGYFQIRPEGAFEVERRYRPDSNILETLIATPDGRARVTESLNSSLAGRLPWSELARRIEGLDGTVRFRIRAIFGTRGDTASPWLQPNPNGCVFHVGPLLGMMRCTPNIRILEEEDRSITATVTLSEGERATVAILAAEDEPLGVLPIEEIDARIDTSDEAWRSWAGDLRYDGPHREAVRRSALALKLLLYSPSGAIAAAATAALPERIGGDKNYDYRYAWIRDAAYTVNAFLRIGAMAESKAAFTWLMQRLGEHGPRVLYTLCGDKAPEARVIEALPGYRGSGPVVIGNAAAHQHQHGVYGDIFETAALFVGGGHIIDQRSARVLSGLADECADRWRQKDSGIWELEEPQHYTMSKISAWQALARAVELAEAGHLPSTCVPRWQRERDRIAAWIDAHCWSEKRRAYTFFPGTERLDASLTLAVRFGFDGRERLSSTLDAIRAELGRGALLYRYSGAEQEEGAFLACSFWMAEALAMLGRDAEAEAVFTGTLDAVAPGVGIMSEMVDPLTGDHLGNTPQGLSHLALIHAACTLQGDRKRPFGSTEGGAGPPGTARG